MGLIGGLLKVYKEFPWVMAENDDEGKKYFLRDEMRWAYKELNGEVRDDIYCIGPPGDKEFIFIDPNRIHKVQNIWNEDIELTAYPACSIELDDGMIYFLADTWENVIDEIEGGNKNE